MNKPEITDYVSGANLKLEKPKTKLDYEDKRMDDDSMFTYTQEIELKNVGTTIEEQIQYLKNRPYKAIKTLQYRKEYARKGHVWLAVEYTRKFLGIKRTYTSGRQFPTEGLDQGVMNHLYDKIWETLRAQYPNDNLPE